MAGMKRKYHLRVDDIPEELLRGVRMVCARKGLLHRQWISMVLYREIDEELKDYPAWRWMSKPGEEMELLRAKKRKAKAPPR